MALGAFALGQVIAPQYAGVPDALSLLADTLRIGMVVGLAVPGIALLVLGLTGTTRR